jgi:hypothetical protein
MRFEDDFYGEEELEEDPMTDEEKATLHAMQEDYFADDSVNFNCAEKGDDPYGGGEEMSEGEWLAYQKSLGLTKEFLGANVYPRYKVAQGEEE